VTEPSFISTTRTAYDTIAAGFAVHARLLRESDPGETLPRAFLPPRVSP
jgi:hypothetical protein